MARKEDKPSLQKAAERQEKNGASGEPPAPKIRVETEDRFLRCDLTPEEVDQYTRELTRAIDEAADAEAEKKAIAAQLKSKIEEALAKVHRLNNVVRNRYEMRHVECAVTHDFDTFKISVIRKDTGDTIEERDMKEIEKSRQRDLFPEETESEQDENEAA